MSRAYACIPARPTLKAHEYQVMSNLLAIGRTTACLIPSPTNLASTQKMIRHAAGTSFLMCYKHIESFRIAQNHQKFMRALDRSTTFSRQHPSRPTLQAHQDTCDMLQALQASQLTLLSSFDMHHRSSAANFCCSRIPSTSPSKQIRKKALRSR